MCFLGWVSALRPPTPYENTFGQYQTELWETSSLDNSITICMLGLTVPCSVGEILLCNPP